MKHLISKFKPFSGALLCLVIIQSVFPVLAQVKTKGVKTTAKTPEFEQSNPALASAWNSGELPAPLPLPAGNTDEVAAILAQKVAAKTEESVPALLTALQISGFFITKKDGSVLLAPPDGKGQGLAINGWEISSAAKMFGDGRATSIADLNERLKSIPAFSGAEPARLLMQGVRANAENTKNPFLRIWARFVLELGKNGQGETADSINAIQHLLIFRRLYGDLFAMAEEYKKQGANASTSQIFESEKLPRFYGASFADADFSSKDDPKKDDPKIPCRMDGNAPTVMDASATVIGKGYGEFMSYLQNAFEGTPTGTALEKAGNVQAVANILLAYAKFVQTYAALEIKLALDGEPPLVRTKNAAPGERKNLHAEVRMNIGNWQMYNCLRMVMNLTAGIDFATVNDGPIGDVGMNWHLDAGGGGDVYSNSTGVTGKEQIVGFAKDGSTRIQDGGTGAGVGTPGTQVGNVRYTKTDSKGIARIVLEGSPQKNAKTYKAKPVLKTAVVRTTVKLKAGEIKGDMVDVVGQAINGVAGLITMPAELIYRTDWASSGTLTVPVKDWEDCQGGWSGTISTVTKFRKEEKLPTNGNLREATKSEDWTLKTNLNLSGEQDRNDGFANAYFADIKVDYEENHYARRFYQEFAAACPSQIIRSTQTQVFERKSKATGDGRVTVFLPMGAGTSGSIVFSTVRAIGERTYSQVYKTGCSIYDQVNTKNEKDKNPYIYETTGFSLVIDIDPANPDVLSGTKTVRNDDGSEMTYSWNLTYCR